MINFIKLGKKFVAGSLIVTTVLWAVGAVSIANAATLQSGSLIKASGQSVYYYASNGKRYVFPNEKTYKTWYSDFSSVITITDAELANMPIGGNVVYRAGTQLVKITTDPKVYAVTPGGTLRWVKTQAVAEALFGANWNQRIDDVPDAFFTNYSIGSDIVNTNDIPDGSLVNVDGTYYYVSGGEKRTVSSNGLSVNGLMTKFALNLSTADMTSLSAGDALSAQDGNIADVAQMGGTTGGTVTPITGNVTVSMGNNMAAGTSVPDGASYVKLMNFNVTNGTNQIVYLNGAKFARTGLISDNTISGTSLTDSKGNLITPVGTFGLGTTTLNLGSDKIEIKAGETISLDFNVNINTAADSGTIGSRIVSATDIMVETASGQAVTVAGTFPMVSPELNIIDGSTILPSVTVELLTLHGGTPTTPTEIDQGQNGVLITGFKLTETTGYGDVEVTNMTIYQEGTASENHFNNIVLKDQDNVVLATIPNFVNNEARISFDNGLVLASGSTKTIRLFADIPDDVNNATRQIELTLQADTALRIKTADGSVGITPVDANYTDDGDWDVVGDNENVYSMRAGTLSVTRDTSSPSGNIAAGQTGLKLGSFKITGYGENNKIEQLTYVIKETSTNGIAENNYALKGTIKLMVGDTVIDSQNANTASLYGTACSTGSISIISNKIACGGDVTVGSGYRANGTATTNTLSVFPVVEAGKSIIVDVIADVNSSATAAMVGYTAELTSIKYKKLSSNTYTTSAITVVGNSLALSNSSLALAKDASYNPANFVKGGQAQVIGSYDITAGPAEDYKISSITVKLGVAEDENADATYDADTNADATNVASAIVWENNTSGEDPNISNEYSYVTNWVLKVDGVLTPAQSVTSSSGTSFSVDYTIPANQTKTIEVLASVASSFGSDASFTTPYIATKMTINSAIGLSSSTTKEAVDIGSNIIGQVTKVLAHGTLAVTKVSDGTINANKVAAAGELGVAILKIKLEETTNAEQIIVKQLNFPEYNLTGNAKNYTLTVGGQQIGSVKNNDSNADIAFTNLNEGENPLIVPLGGSVILTLSADVSDTTNMAAGATTIDGSVGVGYYEYTGAISSTTVKKSGGVFTTTVVDGSNLNVTVKDASLFTATDAVFIDINEDGELSATENGLDAAVTGFVIASVNTSTNVIVLTGGAEATAVSGKENWISATNVRSNIAYLQDVKPVATTHTHTEARSTTSQMFTENVAAVGTRELKVDQITYEITGTWSTGYGPRDLRLYDVQDSGNESNVLSSSPKLAYTPGVNASGLTVTSNTGVTDTNQIGYTNATPGMEIIVGSRIKFGTTYTNNDIGYRVIHVTDPNNDGTSGIITVTPVIDFTAEITATTSITSVVGGNTTITALAAAGANQVTLSSTSGFVENAVITFYDTATSDASTAKGYRITDVPTSGSTITFTPALAVGEDLADAAKVYVDGTALADSVPVEPGAMVRFNFANGSEIGINAGTVKGLTLIGDTSNMIETGANAPTITVKGSGTKVSLTDPFPHVVYTFTDSYSRDHENLVLIPNVPIGSTMY